MPQLLADGAIRLPDEARTEQLGMALAKLMREDPTFRVHTDPDTAQTLISGMGELHLDIITDRLVREFRVGANIGRPHVAYRETITSEATGEGRFVRQSGGRGQYGHCHVRVRPFDGEGMEFEDTTKGGVIPREFIRSIEQGIREALESGPLAGYPVTGVSVEVFDGSSHEVDSSEVAFKIAGSMAWRDAARDADPVLLEPVMSVEVTTPEEYMGDVSGDLSSRRGKVLGMEMHHRTQIVNARVPLSEMFGYATDLRSASQGRANYSMQFESYEPTPRNVSEEVVARAAG